MEFQISLCLFLSPSFSEFLSLIRNFACFCFYYLPHSVLFSIDQCHSSSLASFSLCFLPSFFGFLFFIPSFSFLPWLLSFYSFLLWISSLTSFFRYLVFLLSFLASPSLSSSFNLYSPLLFLDMDMCLLFPKGKEIVPEDRPETAIA